MFIEELALLWLVRWDLALAWAVCMGGAGACTVAVTALVTLVVAGGTTVTPGMCKQA